ncbi:MAG: spinster family MFS transporter [Parasphingopyxis sp.]|nr:MFS transporter [Sphingomonadales bacterium]
MPQIGEAVLPRVESDDERALRRRTLTLTLLTATYFFSYMDRSILWVLMEDIKREMLLSDTQLGLLSGLAFAIFYATLGIPVAWLADRYNRRNIIAVALALWSGMTALCGLAGNFSQLLAARIGVGVGEAGSSPPSHSIIADLYPPQKRASAMAIYSLGVTVGAGAGTIIGGTLAFYFDWRTAFLAVGIPGVILAIFVFLFAVEPRRGLSDADQVMADKTPSIADGFRSLWSTPAARHLVLGVTLTSLIGYGLTSWGPPYYIRSFGLDTRQIGLILAPILMIAGIIGVVGGGRLADWCAGRWGLHAQSYMVAILKTMALPFLFGLYLFGDVYFALGCYFVALLFQSCYLGPTFALLQGLAPLQMRAVWAAITLLVINLIGLGLGPTTIGILSDLFEPRFGDESLRYALLCGASLTPWAIFHYWRAGVLLKRKQEAAAGTPA